MESLADDISWTIIGTTALSGTFRGKQQVVDKLAVLNPRIVVPDHSPPGDGSLLAAERTFFSELVARMAALKRQGKSAEEAGRILAAEFQAKYPDWRSMTRIPDGVQHGWGG